MWRHSNWHNLFRVPPIYPDTFCSTHLSLALAIVDVVLSLAKKKQHDQIRSMADYYSSKDEDSDDQPNERSNDIRHNEMYPTGEQPVSLSADSNSDEPEDYDAKEFAKVVSSESNQNCPGEDHINEQKPDDDDTAENEEVASGKSNQNCTAENESSEQKPDGNMRVVASHYNELRESGLAERSKSRIFHMRNFNNWIKTQLINEYLRKIRAHQRVGDPLRVLDMCCGKGGDLLKYEKSNITHLICTDIAEVSVEDCKRRYEQMVKRSDRSKFTKIFTAEFLSCDSTLVRLRQRYKDPSLKLNLVSCQFAFHYSFESLSQADCMVRNAAECLQHGGYFIATIPDANEIIRRLRASSNNRSFSNDIYSIDFVSDADPPSLFGAKYQFHLHGVVDCPEFLVHFSTLEKLCRKYGLQLERRTTFADYYKECLDTGRTLLQRMNGVETVYINRCPHGEQYEHVRNHAKRVSARSFGTLSKAEWDATTLYLVCAFKKGKTSLDADGNPVFEFDEIPCKSEETSKRKREILEDPCHAKKKKMNT